MGNGILPYNPRLKELARKLRKEGTLSEVILWQQLKGKQVMGLDFHRQKPIDKYIVDFYCPRLMLAIEIDGSSHEHKQVHEEDIMRQERIEVLGVTVLRFDDSEIKNNLEGVVRTIENWTREHTPAFGHPSQEGN